MQQTIPCNILIIDDEEALAQTLATRLELRGMSVQIKHNGKDGLAELSCALPDVVLLDMCMPEISGLQVLREIRQKYGMLPVLIITGYCSETYYESAKELIIQGYHAKPINIEELLSNILAVTAQKI